MITNLWGTPVEVKDDMQLRNGDSVIGGPMPDEHVARGDGFGFEARFNERTGELLSYRELPPTKPDIDAPWPRFSMGPREPDHDDSETTDWVDR